MAWVILFFWVPNYFYVTMLKGQLVPVCASFSVTRSVCGSYGFCHISFIIPRSVAVCRTAAVLLYVKQHFPTLWITLGKNALPNFQFCKHPAILRNANATCPSLKNWGRDLKMCLHNFFFFFVYQRFSNRSPQTFFYSYVFILCFPLLRCDVFG